MKKYNIGDIFEGTIQSISSYGIFVKDGISKENFLVHISEISHSFISLKTTKYKVGDKVKVIIFNFDKEVPKCSIKRLLEDTRPNSKLSTLLTDIDIRNTYFNGNITRLSKFGFFVTLENGLFGLVHRKNLTRDYSSYTIGESIKCKILKYNLERLEIEFLTSN